MSGPSEQDPAPEPGSGEGDGPPAAEGPAGRAAGPEQAGRAGHHDGPEPDAGSPRPPESSTDALRSFRAEEEREDANRFGAEVRTGSANFNVNGGGVLVVGGYVGTVGTAGFGPAGPPLEPGPIDDEQRAALLKSFVEPDRLPHLRQQLGVRHVLVLRAEPGWGRTATAVNLLVESLSAKTPADTASDPAPPAPVRRLEPDTSIRTLDGSGLAEATGYVLDAGDRAEMSTWRSDHLARLSASLRAVSSFLVVLVDGDARFADPLTGHLADGGPPPDPLDILVAHAARAATSRDGLRERLAGDAEVGGWVKDLGRDGPAAGDVAALGGLLADPPADPADSAARARIADWVAARATARFLRWIDQLDDVEQRAFVIALASLNGMRYTEVARAARLLGEALRTPGDNPRPESRPVFDRGRGQRIEAARAVLYPIEDDTLYGREQVEAVRFANDASPTLVLEWVWREQDAVRPILLTWLRTLAEDRNPVLRARAAVVIGVLASWDFDTIRREVLGPLADTRLSWQREVAAAALGVAATAPRTRAMVVGMLDDWPSHTLHPGRVRVATRAWGRAVGAADPAVALTHLRDLAETDDPWFSLLIGRSVVELFEGPDTQLQPSDGDWSPGPIDVLDALGQWTARSGGPELRRSGLLCFLLLMHAEVPGIPDAPTWPHLLLLGDRDERVLSRAATLLHGALNARYVSAAALEALRTWVAAADDDRRLLRPLSRIVRRCLRTDNDLQRLHHAFVRWQPDHPRAAGHLLGLLERISEPDV